MLQQGGVGAKIFSAGLGGKQRKSCPGAELQAGLWETVGAEGEKGGDGEKESVPQGLPGHPVPHPTSGWLGRQQGPCSPWQSGSNSSLGHGHPRGCASQGDWASSAG